MLIYENWDESDTPSGLQNNWDYFDVIKWAYEEYGDKIVYACSFGAEAIVLIDLISKVNNEARIVFLDTGLHFKETYELIDKVKERYPTMDIDMVKPKISLEEQAKWYGDELWKHNPNLCCKMRKVVPLKEAIQDVDAWISGIRREQSPTRRHTEFINKDDTFQKIKICPLIHWTWEDIQLYIEINQLPYHPLHDKGYLSIGCAPCTAPTLDNKDLRAGRWGGTTKLECGLHQS